MFRWKRQGLAYAGLFAGVLAFFTVVYHLGMLHLEGEPTTMLESMQVVVETFTTIGYGSDAGWTDPAMNALVIAMNITSFVLVFMALPLVVVPLLDEALESSPPTELDDASDHVLVCGYTARGETLLDQLSAWERNYAVVVDDEEVALDLHERGELVVHGDPQSAETLRDARAEQARAVVADADDETNASIVLAAREVAPDAQVVATAEDPDDAQYLTYAGADAVLTPRHLLGRSLAEKVTMTVSTEFGEGGELGGDLEVVEVPVEPESEVAGRRLADSGIREETGASVIGAWRRGEFVAPLSAGDVVEPGAVLLVAGTDDQIDRLRELVGSGTDRRTGHVVVVGYGEVGRTVTAELAASDVPYEVVDREDQSGVDVVGEATDEATLSAADVESARAVVLAIPDDTTTAFATLVVRETAQTAEVVARADEADAGQKLYLAGADYVLSLATVSGRMLASEVLDEDVISPEKQVEVVKVAAPALAGKSLREADIRERTGCTVVAIDRGGELLTDLGPEATIEDGDELVVAGSDESVRKFGQFSQ